MSSEALLGSRTQSLSTNALCKQRICRVLQALGHWLSVTSNRKYFGRKSRALWKTSCLVAFLVGAVTFDDKLRFGPGVNHIFACSYNLLASALLLLIPYDSISLDILVVIFNVVDVGSGYYVRAGPGWTFCSIYWIHIGGLHSLAAVPLCLNILFAESGDANFTPTTIKGLLMAVMPLLLLAEWEGASSFCHLQTTAERKQLVLDQATDGQCRLSHESGIVSDASSAFEEHFGSNIDGVEIAHFVQPSDQANVLSLVRKNGTELPGPILATFLRRQTLTGMVVAEFEAKLVPYALTEFECGEIGRWAWSTHGSFTECANT